MAKPKSTHRGHCQACARVQAVNPDTMRLAKHGYTVKGFGFFNGVCHGADRQPLELDRTYCDEILVRLTEYAAQMDTYAAALKDGSAHPFRCNTGKSIKVARGGRMVWEEETVLWEDADTYHREAAVRSAIWSTEMEAKQARRHHADLKRIAKDVHGKPLVERVDREPPLKIEVGMSFTHRGQTWTVRNLVNRGWGRSVNPNYAVCVCEGVERPWTVSTRQVRKFLTM